jgi:hypothetical protein
VLFGLLLLLLHSLLRHCRTMRLIWAVLTSRSYVQPNLHTAGQKDQCPHTLVCTSLKVVHTLPGHLPDSFRSAQLSKLSYLSQGEGGVLAGASSTQHPSLTVNRVKHGSGAGRVVLLQSPPCGVRREAPSAHPALRRSTQPLSLAACSSSRERDPAHGKKSGGSNFHHREEAGFGCTHRIRIQKVQREHAHPQGDAPERSPRRAAVGALDDHVCVSCRVEHDGVHGLQGMQIAEYARSLRIAAQAPTPPRR